MPFSDKFVFRWARMHQGHIDIAVFGQFQRLAGPDRNYLHLDAAAGLEGGQKIAE